MKVLVYPSHDSMARAAAGFAAEKFRTLIEEKGKAVFVVSTGASQIKFLDALCEEEGIDWSRTVMFHLDDYIGLPPDHPGSFGRYLHERLIDRVHPGEYHLIDGNADDPEAEAGRYGRLMESAGVDICMPGIGETGHLALNDPPADFEKKEPFFVTGITEQSRRQLAGEGWFDSWEQCPERAITISIPRIMKSSTIISVVPERRKGAAVARCLVNRVKPEFPASILRTHGDSHLYLDRDSAACLSLITSLDNLPCAFEV